MSWIKPDLKEQHNKHVYHNMAALPVGLPFNVRVRKKTAGQIHYNGLFTISSSHKNNSSLVNIQYTHDNNILRVDAHICYN